jgi:hypothetical protein
LSENNVYMNITFIHDCVLKVIMKNLECEMNVYVNVTYMTIVLKVIMKNLEWKQCLYEYYIYTWLCSQSNYEKSRVCDECLCECYIYDYCSQSNYEKSRVW